MKSIVNNLLLLNVPTQWRRSSQKGYGLTLIFAFLVSSALLASSLQMSLGPIASTQVNGQHNYVTAKQLVKTGLEASKRDIAAQLDAGVVITTAYRYPASGSNTISIPDDPNDLSGASSIIGSYFSTVTHARGNSYFIKTVASVGSSSASQSELFFVSSEPSPVEDIRFIGRDSNNQVGYPVSSAGDVDGDGIDDFIVGARTSAAAGTNTGEAYLLFGRSSTDWNSLIDVNAEFDLDNISDPNRIVRLIGRSSWDYAGRAVKSAGDVNNDGYDDIIIGADRATGADIRAGEAYLILGRSAADWLTFTDANGDFDLNNIDEGNGVYEFDGAVDQDEAGYSVSTAGDVNNDGYDDIFIGARIADNGGTNTGDVYMIFGRSTADWKALATSGHYDLGDATTSTGTFLFIGQDSYDNTGESISCAGDVNNDGYDDILIGAQGGDDGGGGSGEVYLILGRSDADWSTLMGGASQTFNLDDIDLVGTTDAFLFIGRSGGDHMGQWASSAGDVNNDGYDDILMGAEDADGGGSNSGETYLIFGRSTADWNTLVDATNSFDMSNIHLAGSTNMFRFIGRDANDEVGIAVSSAGDVNNDGYDDILLGAAKADEGGADSGEVYLIFGRSTTNWASLADANKDFNLDDISDANQTVMFFGQDAGDALGGSVSGLGDINNDGIDDFMIAAQYADGGGSDSGEVYLFFGRSAAKWIKLTDASGHFNLDNI